MISGRKVACFISFLSKFSSHRHMETWLSIPRATSHHSHLSPASYDCLSPPCSAMTLCLSLEKQNCDCPRLCSWHLTPLRIALLNILLQFHCLYFKCFFHERTVGLWTSRPTSQTGVLGDILRNLQVLQHFKFLHFHLANDIKNVFLIIETKLLQWSSQLKDMSK